MLPLGAMATDCITGMRGMITAQSFYLGGSARVFIQPLQDASGNWPSGCWIDGQRVVPALTMMFPTPPPTPAPRPHPVADQAGELEADGGDVWSRFHRWARGGRHPA